MEENASAEPRLSELVPMRELQHELAHVFPSRGSLEWEVRTNRREYVAAGAIFEVAGRLMAHRPTFEKTALAIAARRMAQRVG